MKNTKRILSVLLAAVMIVAAFAVSISGAAVGDTVYAGRGENELTISEIIAEYSGSGIVGINNPMGQVDVAGDADMGAANFNIGKNKGAKGDYVLMGQAPEDAEDPSKYSGIEPATNIYTGKVSTGAYKFDIGGCTHDSGESYWSFNVGAKGQEYPNGYIFEFDLYIALREDGTTDLPTSGFAMGFFATGAASGAHNHKTIAFKPAEGGKWTLNKGKGSFDAGQWNHITIAYVPATSTTASRYDVYVGDDTTGRYLANTYAASNKNGEILPYHWRITPGINDISITSLADSVYMDNFIGYYATKIHNPFAAKNMEGVEAYRVFMSAVLDPSVPEAARYNAYAAVDADMAKVEAIYNSEEATEEYRAAYDAYMEFTANEENVRTLIDIAKGLNNAEYLRLAKAAAELNTAGVNRTLVNIAARRTAVAVAEEFLASVGDMIFKDSADFREAAMLLAEVTSACDSDESVNEFISAVQVFVKNKEAGFMSPLQESKDKATELYSGLPSPDVYKSSDSKTADYVKARQDYLGIENSLTQLTIEAETKRFVRIVGILCQVMSEEGGLLADEKYERMWKSAYEFVAFSDYDESIEGFTEAYESFMAEDGPHYFFWNRHQAEHIRILTEKLEIFDVPTATYIDKASVCKYVQNYITVNAKYIDSDNEAIAELVDRANLYQQTLGEIEAEYREYLLENSDKFLAAVAELEALTDYASIKAKHEATRAIYYAMEIVGGLEGEVMAAVVKYEQIEDWIADVETDCALYIEIANRIDSVEDEDKFYTELAAAYACGDLLDETYEGISAAKAKLAPIIEAYQQKCVEVNGELYQTVDATCALRSGSFAENVIAFLRSLFD